MDLKSKLGLPKQLRVAGVLCLLYCCLQLTAVVCLLKNASQAQDLNWLNQPLDCSQYVSEIKNRFPSKKILASLPLSERHALNFALDLACTERFAHCNFSSCKNRSKEEVVKPLEVTEVTSAAEAPLVKAPIKEVIIDKKQQAITMLTEIVSSRARIREEKNKSAEKRELDERLAWQRFGIPQELDSLEGRGVSEKRRENAKVQVKPSTLASVEEKQLAIKGAAANLGKKFQAEANRKNEWRKSMNSRQVAPPLPSEP